VKGNITNRYMKINQQQKHHSTHAILQRLTLAYCKSKGFKPRRVNVLWDNGASLCFVTSKKAKEEKLKRTKTELTVVKVGGIKETLATYKHQLSLIDENGQYIQINVYELEKITSDISAIKIPFEWYTQIIQRRTRGRNKKTYWRNRRINWLRIRQMVPAKRTMRRPFTRIKKSLQKMHRRNSPKIKGKN